MSEREVGGGKPGRGGRRRCIEVRGERRKGKISSRNCSGKTEEEGSRERGTGSGGGTGGERRRRGGRGSPED